MEITFARSSCPSIRTPIVAMLTRLASQLLAMLSEHSPGHLPQHSSYLAPCATSLVIMPHRIIVTHLQPHPHLDYIYSPRTYCMTPRAVLLDPIISGKWKWCSSLAMLDAGATDLETGVL